MGFALICPDGAADEKLTAFLGLEAGAVRPVPAGDLKVEGRAVDKDLALVRIIDHLERVPLVWLFRAETLR